MKDIFSFGWFFFSACTVSSDGPTSENNASDLLVPDDSAARNCHAIAIEALERHEEQADFGGVSMQPLSVGLLFLDSDGFSPERVENRQFRLETNGGKEVTDLDGEITGYWPSGNVKWLRLRFNGRLGVAERGYLFYWGDHESCMGDPAEPGALVWLDGNQIHMDTEPLDGCTESGSGCDVMGTGMEGLIDLLGSNIVETLSIDGSQAIQEGIVPMLEGQAHIDGESLGYETQVEWNTGESQVRQGRASAQIYLSGTLISEETPVAHLDVVLDVRRAMPRIGMEMSLTWLQAGETREEFPWLEEVTTSDTSSDWEACSLDEVKYQFHPYDIDRFGLVLRSGSNSVTHGAWGECLGTGKDLDCGDSSTVEMQALGTAPLALKQEGPRMYSIDDVVGDQQHLAGWVSTLGPEVSMEVAVQHFWQTYPSGFILRKQGVAIDLYPDWAPNWSFSFYAPDGSAEDPILYKPLPGHAVPGEDDCSAEEMDFYSLFLQDYLGPSAPSSHCSSDMMQRTQVLAHGASRTHQLELAFYSAAEGDTTRAPKRSSMLNHPVILRQDPASFLRENILGLQMVPKQVAASYLSMENALDEILHLNSLRFTCGHDFGFWHFGKAQGHYGSERFDRWVDGIQYGHQMIPWLLFVRGGDRRSYEEAIIQSRHAFDVAMNKHYLDPEWTGRRVATSPFSASPFNWGYDSLGLHSNLNFLSFYRHLGGNHRVSRFLREYARDVDEPLNGAPKALQLLQNRNRGNFVPNALWALLNEELSHDPGLHDPELSDRLAAYETRWLQRTFSINDLDWDNDGAPDDVGWGPNYLPYNGLQSIFAFPNKGLERGFLAQWARGNFLSESESLSGISYFSYVLEHAEENGFVHDIWRGLNRMESIQLGPMLSTITGDEMFAKRSWIHGDRIARVMPRWDGLVQDSANPVDNGKPPMLTDHFEEGKFRDLTHALLAGITARAIWDPSESWVEGEFSDTLFKIQEDCSMAWIRPDSTLDSEIHLVVEGTAADFPSYGPWMVEIEIYSTDGDAVLESVLYEGPLVFFRPDLDEELVSGPNGVSFDLYQFPESLHMALVLAPSENDYLVVARYTDPHRSNTYGYFQVTPVDSHTKVVHDRPVGSNGYNPMDVAGQGAHNLTKLDQFTGASLWVKLEASDTADLLLWDMQGYDTEPFSYRDSDGVPQQISQTATYNSFDGSMKERIVVNNPPMDWIELTVAGQGYGRLGIDGQEEPFRRRSDFVPATLDTNQWFEPRMPSPSCGEVSFD